jgi:hypothetical protein
MALCEICMENHLPGQGLEARFQECPECGGEVTCSGYTHLSHERQTIRSPVCEECGQAPILVCSLCGWHNTAYDDVLFGLKDS